MTKFCCIDNEDIINNKNYTNTVYNKNSSDEKYNSILPAPEKLPLNLIQLNNLNLSNHDSSSKLDLTSKYVIIKKEGSPLNDYEILSKIGEGTFGKVFKVRNKHDGKIRAMKEISEYNLSERRKKKLMEEIEILKNLNHIYIIKLYEYYVTEDYIYLINELSEEGDLFNKMIKIGFFPEFIVKIIMLQIFQALMYLNEKNVIHGDLKLENILVVSYKDEEKKKKKREDGFIQAIKHDMKIINGYLEDNISKTKTVKIFDKKYINDLNKSIKQNYKNQEININTFQTNFKFISKEKQKEKELNKKNNIYKNREELEIYNYGIKLIDFGCSKIFTRTKKNFSDIIGTVVYNSPEVMAGNYNKTCDIWSCGVIMYYLLSGHLPFDGETEEEITNKILEAKFEFDVEHFKNISEEAKDLIRKCLKYEPKKRITIEKALNHKFFDDLKEAITYTEEDKNKLKKLKTLNKKSKFYQIVMTYLSYHYLDNKLLNELNRLYNKLDKNKDYRITKTELYNAYKEANIPISKKEVDEIINSIDYNNNGDIDYEEFIRSCIPKEKLFTDENLENAFSMFDIQKKGFITPKEIIDFIESTKQIKEKLKLKIKNEITDIVDEIIDIDTFKEFMVNLSNANV